MTEPQRRALTYLASVEMASPAALGQGMGGTRRGNAQGLGRLGGAMGSRLVKLGWARDLSHKCHGFPAYGISSLGRRALEENRG
jgi:hypothetical protein